MDKLFQKIQIIIKKSILLLLMDIKEDKKITSLFLVLDQIKVQELDFSKIQED
jgi:ABC-type oligopeptide transport system ATPase subunit